MPVGQSSTTKHKKKEDMSQKVQEIKQRQQNWFKQRELSKQQEESGPKSKVSLPVQKRPNAASSASKRGSAQTTGKVITKQVTASTNKPDVRERFKHWIDARNPTGSRDEDDHDFSDLNSIRSGAESELERLVTPELNSSSFPVLEENFEDLAEKVASKVKGDLGLSGTNSALSQTTASTEITLEDEKPAWRSSRCKTFTQEVPTFNHLGTSGLTSHSCTVCRKLMLSSKNIPMMVIPCGHTLCKMCSEGRLTCPSCDCPIVSLTVNIMLQQVIQEYHSHPVPSSFINECSEPYEGSSNEHHCSPAKYKEDNCRNTMASYKKQLATLETRHEILLSEHKTLIDKQKQITNRLHQDELQVQNIVKQEEEMEKTIIELQERLKGFREHRKYYASQVSGLKDEKSELEGKLTLLSSTISSLVREMEKVKLLSEGENIAGAR